MQNEKLATIALGIIVIMAVGSYLVLEYDVLDNILDEDDTSDTNTTIPTTLEEVEYGDCADLHYIGRYANGTIFDTSYDDPESKTGGTPLNVFVSLNSSQSPPEGYEAYMTMIEGFTEGIVGLKENESAALPAIPPEKGYGVKPTIGDVIEIAADPSIGFDGYQLEVIEIVENSSVPPDYTDYVEGDTTTLYKIRDISHEVGDIVDVYPSWENSTVITKVNDTKAWYKTTPPEDELDNFTWKEYNAMTGMVDSYWVGASDAVVNDTHIVVTHTPQIGDTLEISNGYSTMTYTVVSYNETWINCSYTDTEDNIAYLDLPRTVTITRNESQNILYEWPSEFLEMFIEFMKQQIDPTIPYSFTDMAGETLYFEVEILDVYKTSQL